jgi:hypothetical protein
MHCPLGSALLVTPCYSAYLYILQAEKGRKKIFFFQNNGLVFFKTPLSEKEAKRKIDPQEN